jgi:hypothetical protein
MARVKAAAVAGVAVLVMCMCFFAFAALGGSPLHAGAAEVTQEGQARAELHARLARGLTAMEKKMADLVTAIDRLNHGIGEAQGVRSVRSVEGDPHQAGDQQVDVAAAAAAAASAAAAAADAAAVLRSGQVVTGNAQGGGSDGASAFSWSAMGNCTWSWGKFAHEPRKDATAHMGIVDKLEAKSIVSWLADGGALGAIRHGGPIPFDGDMDVVIPVWLQEVSMRTCVPPLLHTPHRCCSC